MNIFFRFKNSMKNKALCRQAAALTIAVVMMTTFALSVSAGGSTAHVSGNSAYDMRTSKRSSTTKASETTAATESTTTTTEAEPRSIATDGTAAAAAAPHRNIRLDVVIAIPPYECLSIWQKVC